MANGALAPGSTGLGDGRRGQAVVAVAEAGGFSEGLGWLFVAVDHCVEDVVGWH